MHVIYTYYVLQEHVNNAAKKRSTVPRKLGKMTGKKVMSRKSSPKKSFLQRLFGKKNRVTPSTPAHFPSPDIVSQSSSATYDSWALEVESLDGESVGYQVS